MKINLKYPVFFHVSILCFLSSIPLTFSSCSEDGLSEVVETSVDEDNDIVGQEENNPDPEVTNECPSDIGFVFEETNGIVSIEFEDNDFPEGWVLKTDGDGTSGSGYMQWEGDPKMNAPGT